MEAMDNDRYYTYKDYVQWVGDARYELIDGEAHMMAPAPSEAHQSILFELAGQFWSYLKGKQCKAFVAPFDVRLNAADNDDTVVQPDLLVVCDRSKLDGKSCKGAPDLIIEILSPSSGKRDYWMKFNKYRQAGVREYWIVDPDSKIASVYILENGNYYASAYCETDNVAVHVLEGCTINLTDVFALLNPK